jgi:replicative DNA helicase
LQLIRAPGKEIRERVGAATDALRQLAKKERVAVLLLSQLSRPKDGNLNSRPTMLQLKESGDIECHSHVVLLLYCPSENDLPTREDEIIVGKNRHGERGPTRVTFNPKSLKFVPRKG